MRQNIDVVGAGKSIVCGLVVSVTVVGFDHVAAGKAEALSNV